MSLGLHSMATVTICLFFTNQIPYSLPFYFLFPKMISILLMIPYLFYCLLFVAQSFPCFSVKFTILIPVSIVLNVCVLFEVVDCVLLLFLLLHSLCDLQSDIIILFKLYKVLSRLEQHRVVFRTKH